MTSYNNMPPNIALMRMITSYRVSQVLYVTAKLGLADLLKDGPKRSEELAQVTGSFQPALDRFLPALVSLGILAQDAQDRYELTSSGAYFQSDHPLSVHAYTLFIAGEIEWQTWGKLEHSLLTGDSAFKQTFGMNLFEYYSQHPEDGDIFDKAMGATSENISRDILEAYDFSQYKKVVDVGGGNGSLLVSLLKANPSLQGVLFDLPQVTSRATKLLEKAAVKDRCEVIGGDFFKQVPGGGDVYIFKLILHDWDDEKATDILKSCYQAMGGKARLVVVEQLQPDRVEISEFHQTLITRDLNMLALFGGGRERNKTEFEQLFERAGFDLVQVIPLSSQFNIIEAIKTTIV